MSLDLPVVLSSGEFFTILSGKEFQGKCIKLDTEKKL